MSFQHPAHYNVQGFVILQCGVICAAATLIDLLASNVGLTMVFLSLFSSFFIYYMSTSVLWFHIHCFFKYGYLTPLYIWFTCTCLVFSQYVIHSFTFVRYSLLQQQILVQNIASYCLMYKFQVTSFQLCVHDMLMCC